MGLKKIKDNYFENLKMSKYELFVKVIDYIGNFPNILDGFYINGKEVDSLALSNAQLNVK